MTLTVTNVLDGGTGSFRQAILDANASPGLDIITFQIPGSGAHTISPATPLPAITDPVIIDGTTQTGFGGSPLIEVSGASAGNNAGLRLLAGGSTVRGLVINQFLAQGILVQGPGTNLIAGNFIGLDVSGTLSKPNGQQGIWINGSSGNTVGGTSAADRNVVSGNRDAGVYLQSASGNIVQGNFVGTTAVGTAAVSNATHGVVVLTAAGNIIGGTSSGAGNLISGNGGSGIYLNGASTAGNLIQGNYIGVDVHGSAPIPNAGDGISILSAGGNFIGGNAAGAGNVISANAQGGVSLSSAPRNSLQGNFIGTDVTGRQALGNAFAGITLSGSSSNSIGDVLPSAGNVISGNKKDGVFMTTNSAGNVLAGNYIGVDTTGTNSLPNLFNGVTLNSASSNLIGGSVTAARNVISGNSSYGLQILAAATLNQVQGNYIGADSSGHIAVANQFSGIEIESASNLIGGTASGAGNLLSGNLQDGITLLGPNAKSNTIQGNLIGTTAGGMSALGNNRAGLGLSDAPANLIGGAIGGRGNVISANTGAGVYLIGSGVTQNEVSGNLIGTDITGTAALGNTRWGIYVERATTNTIGGAGASARNIISANGTWGLMLTNSSWIIVQGNYLGTAADGATPLGNGNSLAGFHNIELALGAHDNFIGGSQPGAGNIIAFAPFLNNTAYAGVRVRDGSTNNWISANSIFSNGGLGIDLGTAGVTPNDNCDSDTGANMLQNFPVLSAAATGTAIGVRGSLISAAHTTFRLEFFANPACAPSGNGQGQLFLGAKSVTTDASCGTNFVTAFAGTLPAGYVVTSTATDPANNTSEFSACVTVAPLPPLTIATPSASANQVTLGWTNTVPGLVLKQTSNLSPPIQWTTVTNVPVLANGQYTVTLATSTTNKFFVLSFE